ncbi:SEL1-like repeat protein, partial [Acinetobacter sp. 11520]|nr:SEL1-like repeat protein [Acinetobacter sp. 11520]
MKFRFLLILSVILTSACSEGSQNSTQGTLTKDYRKVSDYKSKEDLESAAKANDPEAVFVLGSMYATGEGVEFSQKKAFELFEKSAKLG